MKNKSIVCDQPHHLAIREMDRPTLGPGDALLRIRRVGVCGTDFHAYKGEQPFFEYPRILGHELAAEIVELAEPHPELSIGDLVAVVPYLPCGQCIACQRQRPNCCAAVRVLGVHIDGGMREWLTVPVEALVSSQGLDADRLALVECLAIGAHAVRRADVQAGEDVLVLGAGPIGLGVLQFAKAKGARILVADLQEGRLDFCRQRFGVEDTLRADETMAGVLREKTGGHYPMVVFDATGDASSMCGAIQLCGHSAKLVYVGLVKNEIRFHHPELHKRELDLLASRNATREDFRTVIDGLCSDEIHASCYVTHRSSIDEFVNDFQRWVAPESGVLKGLLEV